jgi:hypothetical protein
MLDAFRGAVRRLPLEHEHECFYPNTWMLSRVSRKMPRPLEIKLHRT